MSKQIQPQTNIRDGVTLRTKQSDTLEFLAAASQADPLGVEWLMDQRIDIARSAP